MPVPISLHRGSSWREGIDFSDVDDGALTAYGDGPAPEVRCDDIVEAWAATPGTTYVYQADVGLVVDPQNGRGRLWEDSDQLVTVASVAACDATPGSFFYDTTTGTVYVHPAGSTDPTSNGRLYEATARLYGYDAEYRTGHTVEGVHFRRNGSDNGALRLGPESAVRRVVCSDGIKHNGLISGGTVEDFLAVRADPSGTGATQTMLVQFLPDPTEQEGTLERAFLVGDPQGGLPFTPASAIYAHGGAGTENYLAVDWRRVAAVDLSFIGSPRARTVSWTDLYARNACNEAGVGAIADSASLRRPLLNLVEDSLAGQILRFDPIGSSTDAEVADGAVFVGVPTTREVWRVQSPGTYRLLRSAFVMGGGTGRPVMATTGGWTSGSLEARHSVLFGQPGGAGYHLRYEAGAAYTGDFNVFFDPRNNRELTARAGSDSFTALAAWQAATGQDANSVYLDSTDQVAGGAGAFWLGWTEAGGGVDLATVGPAVGDFRVNPSARVLGADGTAYVGTFADGSTPITAAGPQERWDWDARALLPGPPEAWPRVPTTLTECLEYQAAPQAWSFYGP